MIVTTPLAAHSDDRGQITDLLIGERIDAITLITSRAGVVRGNHYHRETVQWVYLLEGRLRVSAQREPGPVEEREIVPGQLVCHEAMEAHSIFAIEDSSFLVFTKGPRQGEAYESDTYRLGQPLQESEARKP
jgi:quercetin dioxygenase-like cupin family protein